MNLYAIRDRLLDYYMQPFVGPTDKQVLASIANIVNSETSENAITKAPHHFEIWRLAKITEATGWVERQLSLLADCSSLVRPGVRDSRTSGTHQAAPTPPERTGSPPDPAKLPPSPNGAHAPNPLTTSLAPPENNPRHR